MALRLSTRSAAAAAVWSRFLIHAAWKVNSDSLSLSFHPSRSSSWPKPRALSTTVPGEDELVEEGAPRVVIQKKLAKLPPGICKPEDEFTRLRRGKTVMWQAQKMERLSRLWLRELLDFPTVAAISVTGSLVVGCGIFEATLLCSDPVHTSFCLNYALENVVPSFIWATKPADLVASSMGLDPQEVLHDWSDVGADARRHLQVYSCEAGRCILASFTLLTQILRAISRSLRVGDIFAEGIQRGIEPPLAKVPERVVRLCGRTSAVTIVSLERYGPHIMPVFDKPSPKTDWLIREYSPWPYFPMYMAIDSKAFGAPWAWENLLRVSNKSINEWLLRTDFGYSILCLEADGTCTDDSFLSRSCPNEITIEQASRAFRQLEQLTSERLRRYGCYNHKVLRVFLGDTLASAETGGGVQYTLRDRVLLRHEVDVLIDSHAPIWQKIVRWWRSKIRDDGEADLLCFETSDAEYFRTVRDTMGFYDVSVVDQASIHGLKAVQVEGTKKHRSTSWMHDREIDVPLLIYYPSTSETVNATFSLLENNEVDPSNLCVIVDQYWAVRELEKLKDEAGDFMVICTAVIYDDLFRQVRQWGRMGFSGGEIQSGLDERYSEFLSNQQKLLKSLPPAGESRPRPNEDK